MKNYLKSVFAEECRHVVIDAAFVKRLQQYQLAFVNKNQEHIKFFGGNLTGVQVVRFLGADRNRWFDEILEIDDGPLEDRVHSLPTINTEWHVSSDVMNLSCAWVLHALYTSKLTPELKNQGMIATMLVLHAKYLTSLLYRYFPYPADPEVAEAAYAALSYKFAIKEHGSWSALLQARSEEVIAKSSIHYDTIATFDSDKEIVYFLNDTQGRIRDMLKNIYRVFKEVHDQGIRIVATSSVVEHDGVEILRDKNKSVLAYGRYLNSIISDRNSFIKQELVTVVEKVMHTMPPALFEMTLTWMSNNYQQTGASVIEEVVNEALIHAFDYLSNNRAIVRNPHDLPLLLSKLRGVVMSSRSTDPALLVLRDKLEQIVQSATHNKNQSNVASVRTGVYLYLILRAFTMRHYIAGS